MIQTITVNGSHGATCDSEHRKQVFANHFVETAECHIRKHFGNPATEFLVESAFGNDRVGALCQTDCPHVI